MFNFSKAIAGVGIATLLTATVSAYAGTLLSEGFDGAAVPTGWTIVNRSAAVGPDTWQKGNPGEFAAQSGAADSYLSVDYLAGTSVISDWLITPTLSLNNGAVLTFYTRSQVNEPDFPDRMQVRLSTNGASSNVGTTAASVGDFTSLLLDINPTYSSAPPPAGYPYADWAAYSVTVSGLSGPVSGRFAFRYLIDDASVHGNYIGLDSVTVVPEPDSIALLAVGATTLGFALRRRKVRA